MSINNREDANKYYELINNLIDDYLEKWKIKPSNLRKYFKKGSDKFNKFIDRNGLREIKGINQILDDIIDDRVSLERDGVITFEKFKLFESEDYKISSIKKCLYKGIGKTDIKAEKALADYFDTNLSQIDIIDSDRHEFKVKDWESEKTAIVYNSDEFDIIKTNVIEYMTSQIKSKEIDIEGIKFKVESLIDSNKLNEQIEGQLSTEKIVELISEALGDFKFIKDDNHYLWIKNATEKKDVKSKDKNRANFGWNDAIRHLGKRD